MGKKIPYDQALQLGRTEHNDSIYAKENPYGFQINVNHPKIRPLYERYKEKIGERILSDIQRREFENHIFSILKRGKK
ncbi:MAG: hypothetical protein IKO47_08685 [Ruminococcus sp.]|nr:hypothetical protein [Ruminococcus sp.]